MVVTMKSTTPVPRMHIATESVIIAAGLPTSSSSSPLIALTDNSFNDFVASSKDITTTPATTIDRLGSSEQRGKLQGQSTAKNHQEAALAGLVSLSSYQSGDSRNSKAKSTNSRSNRGASTSAAKKSRRTAIMSQNNNNNGKSKSSTDYVKELCVNDGN